MEVTVGVVGEAGGGGVLVTGVVGETNRTPALADVDGRVALFAEELNDWSQRARDVRDLNRIC